MIRFVNTRSKSIAALMEGMIAQPGAAVAAPGWQAGRRTAHVRPTR
jgi:hypothetical protein